MTPSISVLTTLYNHSQYIEETIESALRQTVPPFEVIVIDDASTDDSINVVSRLRHPSVHLFSEKRNLGGATTMKGLAKCRGDYIAILNSDDRWAPDKLERQLAYLERHPDCGVCFTWPTLIDETGRRWPYSGHYLYWIFHKRDRDRFAWLRELFDNGNCFCASSALIRRACLQQLGGLDGRYVQLQDYEMWTRIATSGFTVGIIEEELTYYRVSRNRQNMSANGSSARAREIFEYSRALRNFWRIASADELFRIFPDSDLSNRRDDHLIKFYLALIASRRHTVQHRQFAVDSLFEIGADSTAMALAYDLFGFAHGHYRQFLAANPLGVIEQERWITRIKQILVSVLPHQIVQQLRRLRRRSLRFAARG
jgi:glycosyltransferase involved in cell wall biosynthesis